MRKDLLFLLVVSCLTLRVASAVEIGHYNGGIFDIRDFFVPPQPGFYGGIYNYYYTTDRLNNGSGNKINSVTINTGSGLMSAVDVNLNTYANFPVFMWVAPSNILGARYGAYVAPCFVNNSLEAKLLVADRVGGTFEDSTLAPGDLFVQPIWLDWTKPHWDCALAYGFYAPVGRYSVQTLALPRGTDVRVESRDNIGLGYWTQQVQGGVAWYPMTNHATAVTAALTYEYNSKQQDLELKPGQMLTLNWGISQYLPLCGSKKLLLEVGPAGYDGWQITDSTGGDAILGDALSQVHAVGGQISLAYVPWSAFLTVHGFYEYAAKNRFQGASLGLNVGIKF